MLQKSILRKPKWGAQAVARGARPLLAPSWSDGTGTVCCTSLTHGIKSHATFSAADAFRKILNDKSEIPLNHVYFKGGESSRQFHGLQ